MELSKEALAAARETLAEIKSRMPPGPAFIPYTWAWNQPGDAPALLVRLCFNIPEGYVWQAATEGTMAGWVRARRVTTAPPEAVPAVGDKFRLTDERGLLNYGC